MTPLNFASAWVWAALLAVSVGGRVAAQDPAFRELTPQMVSDSLDRAVQFLRRQQAPDGGWAEYERQPGGVASLCVMALLNAGVPVTDPQVKKGLDFLERQDDPKATYAASLHIMAFVQADPARYKLKIAKLARWLEAHQIKEGDLRGGWSYFETALRPDASNSQFAVLALHEAERAGVRIDDRTWQLALKYWLTPGIFDQTSGGFAYEAGQPVTGSMTCAGVASLIIIRDRLAKGEASVANGHISCCGAEAEGDEIERAIAWLGRNFSVNRNPGNDVRAHPWLLYYLYGMERVGRMSSRRFFFGRAKTNPVTGADETPRYDWYREGCQVLLGAQDSLNGSWKGEGLERNPVISTALALLFLSKGKRPVVMARVKVGPGEIWNHHRRGVHHLVSRIEKQWRRDLSWQTIDLAGATVADLAEAPVLFLSGSEALQLTPQMKKTLAEYANQGGFLFIEACNGSGCSGAAFDADIRRVLREMFPDSTLRKLPPDHAVWFAQERVIPNNLPQDPDFWLWGLDTCCRTSVVYCPRPLSCYWELAHPYREQDYSQRVKDEIEAVTRIGGNVIAYATNRELKEKLQRPQLAISAAGGKTPRGALVIPKLSHGGGSDDAPHALNNLLLVVEKQLQLKVDYERRLLAPTDPKLLDYPLVFAHGRRGFRWSEAERKAMKDYLDRGGFLFADSICGSPQFIEALRAELAVLYPQGKLLRVPAGHPLLTDELQGFSLASVSLRDPQLRTADDPLTARLIKGPPVLEALEIDGRIAVVLSPYDLSCALEKGASLDCKGYLPPDAARIGANIILYALQQ